MQSRPSVKSIWTVAPAARQRRMSICASRTRSSRNSSREYAGNAAAGIQQRQRRRGDHGLLHRPGRVLLRALEVARGVGRVAEGPGGQNGKLPGVAVPERDRDAAGREVRRAVDRVSREARLPLLAVRDDGRARLLEAAERVAHRAVEERLERIAGDPARAERAHAFDQLLGSWNTSDGFRGQRHAR